MTRATMRTLLRRRIDDPNEEDNLAQWTNAELDEILNLAAVDVASAIRRVNPTAFIAVSRANIVADESLVPLPSNAGPLLDVRKYNATLTPPAYRTMGDPVPFDLLNELPSDSTTARFSIVGRWIKLGPTPESNVTDGLEFWFVQSPEIASGEEDDDRTFPFDLALHEAVVIKAQILCGQEGDGSNVEQLVQLYGLELQKIPEIYRRTVGREVGFSINLTKIGQV